MYTRVGCLEIIPDHLQSYVVSLKEKNTHIKQNILVSSHYLKTENTHFYAFNVS